MKMNGTQREIGKYVRAHQRRRNWRKVIICLAAVVVFCTTYMLILPAITMVEKSDPTADVESAEVWEATFADVKLTGDYAADLLLIAQTQLGYTESTKNFVYVAGDSLDGYGSSDGRLVDDESDDAEAVPEADETENVTNTEELESADTEETNPSDEVAPESNTEETDAAGKAESEETASSAYTALYAALTALYDEAQTYEVQAGDDMDTLVNLCQDAYNAATEYATQIETLYVSGSLTEDEYNELIALSQAIQGYVDELVDGLNLTKKGYTRYGAWYGDAYGDWCAMFVSFCLNYAEIPSSDFPREGNCQRWIEKLSGQTAGYEDFDFYTESGEYIPDPGDLIFFDWNGDGSSDHVGIVVEYIEAVYNSDGTEKTPAQVKTLEGNSDNKVQYVTYDYDDEDIMGYGMMPDNLILTYEGEDYTVTVTYHADAELPKLEDMELRVSEYAQDSETYLQRYAEADALYGWNTAIAEAEGTEGTGSDFHGFRLFDISLWSNGEEVQPAAPVQVTVSYLNETASAEYQVTHFGEDETETVSAESSYKDGVQNVDFAANGFSDYGISLAAEEDSGLTELNGVTVGLFNGATGYVLMNTAAESASNRLAGALYGYEYEQNDADSLLYTALLVDENVDELKNSLLIWTFEAVDAESRQYRLKTEINETTYYLYNDGSAVGVTSETSSTNYITYSIFTVTAGTGDYEGQVRLTNVNGSAINRYGNSDYFGPYNDGSSYEYFYMVTDITMIGNTVKGVKTSNIVTNLFDYWVVKDTENGTYPNYLSEEGDYNDGLNVYPSGGDTGTNIQGINNGHALKFTLGMTGTKINEYDSLGYSEIVERTLTNGYPMLTSGAVQSVNDALNSSYTVETLNYLFDPTYDISEDIRVAYTNVKGLFQLDDEGYYYYDSQQNFAELDRDENEIILYDTWGVTSNGATAKGQFFPFNSFSDSYNSNSKSAEIDHYFGMTLTTDFTMQYDGYVDKEQTTPMIFEFSGDDDVWIFIDDVLVADLGGIHDALSVSIDFSTGHIDITCDGVTVENNAQSNYLYTQYTWADATGNTSWTTIDEDGGETAENMIYANGTQHTLEFFYLERGNVDSNLKLTTNLTEYVPTNIYKVDQYGNPVENATFAAYPAYENDEGDYLYITDATDETVSTTLSLSDMTQVYSGTENLENNQYYVDTTTGVITVKYNDTVYTITPGYVGTTDANGTMYFVYEDGSYYSYYDMVNALGTEFILREIAVPDGYRLISSEIWLYFQNEVLLVKNYADSGVSVSNHVQVTATQTLYTVPDENDKYDTIDYYEAGDSDSVNGTLFAVVLKKGDNENNVTVDNWYPVYGDSENGYTVVDYNSEDNDYDSQLAAAIAAAKSAADYGDVVFTMGEGGLMQVYLTNLPGDISEYYTFIQDMYAADDDDSNDNVESVRAASEYFVAYYYTTADSLDEATAENTTRVVSRARVIDGYSGFSLSWGATITISNYENRVYFQKVDEDGDAVNDAVFALYSVGEDTNGNIYYIADDGTYVYLGADANGTNTGTATVNGVTGTYTVSAGDTYDKGSDGSVTTDDYGVITVTVGNVTYTITPVQVDYTHETCSLLGATVGAGTGHFTGLDSGLYVMREIYAPDPYALNTTEVKIYIDGEAVYADAGTATDGVAVGKGPGYLAASLSELASEGDVDNTLTWIYTMLQVTDSSSFTELQSTISSDDWSYATTAGTSVYGQAGTGTTNTKSEGIVTYLEYDNTSGSSIFDYSANGVSGGTRSGTERAETETIEEQMARTNEDGNTLTADGEGTRRLYTETGWSRLAIYQDYEYGSVQAALTGASYEDMTDSGDNGDISALFSRSTFIVVTDEVEVNLEIEKVDAEGTANLSGAEFLLYYTETAENGTTVYRYYTYDESNGTLWVTDESSADILTTGSTIITAVTVIGTTDVESVDEDMTPELPATLDVGVGDTTISEVTVTWGTPVWSGDDSYWSVTGTLTLPENSGYTLADGAEITATLTYSESVSETSLNTATATLAYQTISVYNLTPGTYYLEEISAPAGYYLLTEPVTITVSASGEVTVSYGGNIYSDSTGSGSGWSIAQKEIEVENEDGNTSTVTDEYTWVLTIPNIDGYELPYTGGSGNTMLYTIALLLTIGAGAGLLSRKRRGMKYGR